MIPQLETLIRTQEQLPDSTRVSCLKLHNGLAYRNPKVSFVAFREREPILFLKSVRISSDSEVIERAHQALQRAYADQARLSFGLQVPAPAWCVSLQGVSVSAESIITGRPLNIHDQKERERGLDVLRTWQMLAEKESTDDVDIIALYQTLCKGIACQPQLQRELDVQFQSLFRQAEGATLRVPRIPAHGDFTPSNVLMLPHGGLGAVDWDRYGDIDMPLFDVLTFVERIVDKHANPFQVYRAELQRQLRLFKCPDKAFPLLVFLYILGTEWRKRQRVHPYERAVIDDEFTATLQLTMGWLHSWA